MNGNATNLVRQLYDLVEEFQRGFPARRFTPDGHLVGSLGEAFASEAYGLDLAPMSQPGHDATGEVGGRRVNVQIKTTQVSSIRISSEPEHLLALKLNRDGSFEEVYNGSGAPVWALVRDKPRPKNSQYPIALSALRTLNREFRSDQRLVRSLGSARARPFGLCKGEFIVPDDFDAPLPEEVLDDFEGGADPGRS